MKWNLSLSASYPLVAAIEASLLDKESLSNSYDPSRGAMEGLKVAHFEGDGPASILILNG